MSKIEIFDIIGAGLKAEAVRQRTIANNVANLQTPGYHRLDVRFEDLLAEVLDSSDKDEMQEIQAEIFQPNDTPVNSSGNNVNLEMEVGQMVENSLRHKTYIRLLQKKYQQIDLAIEVK